MNFSARPLENATDVLLVRSAKLVDERGYFMETWTKDSFAKIGILANFVQDNESLSTRKGTLRGLHFQREPHEQAKLVRVLKGAIYDVVVDIRTTSPNFGRWFGVVLSVEKGEMLFVPRGFAHGFVTITNETTVSYKVDAPYSREREAGIIWKDSTLDIRWPVAHNEIIVSEKDALLPVFRDSIASGEDGGGEKKY